MTSLDDPQAIRHFQSICDACQELTTRYHTPSELRLYADGYLHALRKTGSLDIREQHRLEQLRPRSTPKRRIATISGTTWSGLGRGKFTV